MSDDSSMNLMDLADHVSNENEAMDAGYDPFDDVVEEGDFEEASDDDSIEASSDDSEESEDQAPEDAEEPSDEPIEEASEESDEDVEKEEESEEEEAEEISPEESLQALNEKLENGELEIKLDEETAVSLKELKNNYVTSKEIQRKFSELDVEKKSVERDVEEINGYINEFAGKLRDGDSVGAMQYFGEFAGVPPYMVKEQLIAALKPEIIRREQMSATDIQNEYLQNQNEYLQQQRESELERQNFEQTQRELETQINQIRETQNIDRSEWDEATSYLQENLDSGEELTPELVSNFIQSERNYIQAASVVEGFEGQLNDVDKWVESLADIKSQHPTFTDEDLKEVLQTAYENLSKKDTESKLAKKVESKKTVSKKQQTKPKAQSQESDDIDPELDDWL